MSLTNKDELSVLLLSATLISPQFIQSGAILSSVRMSCVEKTSRSGPSFEVVALLSFDFLSVNLLIDYFVEYLFSLFLV